MGPRFFKRGNMKYAIDINGLRIASMGPRFFKRGNEAGTQQLTTENI